MSYDRDADLSSPGTDQRCSRLETPAPTSRNRGRPEEPPGRPRGGCRVESTRVRDDEDERPATSPVEPAIRTSRRSCFDPSKPSGPGSRTTTATINSAASWVPPWRRAEPRSGQRPNEKKTSRREMFRRDVRLRSSPRTTRLRLSPFVSVRLRSTPRDVRSLASHAPRSSHGCASAVPFRLLLRLAASTTASATLTASLTAATSCTRRTSAPPIEPPRTPHHTPSPRLCPPPSLVRSRRPGNPFSTRRRASAPPRRRRRLGAPCSRAFPADFPANPNTPS